MNSLVYMGSTWCNDLMTRLVLLGVLFYGGHLVLTGRLTYDALLSFVLYQLQLEDNFFVSSAALIVARLYRKAPKSAWSLFIIYQFVDKVNSLL